MEGCVCASAHLSVLHGHQTIKMTCNRNCRHAVAVALTAVSTAKDAFLAKGSPDHAHSKAQALTALAALLRSCPDKDSQAQALSGD